MKKYTLQAQIKADKVQDELCFSQDSSHWFPLKTRTSVLGGEERRRGIDGGCGGHGGLGNYRAMN